MKLNIPTTLFTSLRSPSTPKSSGSPDQSDDQSTTIFLTPQRNMSIEEFQTPNCEIPPPYSALYTRRTSGQIVVTSPDDGDDSGLDENFHTPRLSKIKSLENISIQMSLERNSPRRLKHMSAYEMTKVRSLNNLVYEIEEECVKEELENDIFIVPRLQTPPKNGKFRKNKIGNAKFIGIDDDVISELPEKKSYPIAKMKSLGTIPDIIAGEKIEYEPFLTPLLARKIEQLKKQQEESVDMVDGPTAMTTNKWMVKNFHGSFEHLRSGGVSCFETPPFERGYRRSYQQRNNNNLVVQNSTPTRQSDGFVYYLEMAENRHNKVSTTRYDF